MSFYQGRRVVVTGGAGMVGSSLVAELVRRGADVLVQDNFSRGKTYIKGASYVTTDAGYYAACKKALEGAFALFNLAAAVAGVEFNQHNHGMMFDANMRLQATPMLAAAAAGVPHVLQVSSVCVYAPEYNSPAREDYGRIGEPHPANSGYAWAKRMGERCALWAQLEHAVIVRPSNIYGPRDYFDERAHVIPKMIKLCLQGDGPIVTRGSGVTEREFIYVDDVARGMLAALEHGQHGEAYNLGTGGDTCVSMAALLRMVRDAAGMEHRPIERLPAAFDEGDPRRWSDVDRLRSLGWCHEIGLDEGLARTVDWYRGRL